MNEPLIRDCWNIIVRMDAGVLDDSTLPLVNMESHLTIFNLPPLPTLRPAGVDGEDLSGVEPKFKHLTGDILLSLRRHVYAGTETEAVSAWAEVVMRFCEIKYYALGKTALKKWGGEAAARLNMLQLVSFFLDYGESTGDARFLNIALKLADLKWVVERDTMVERLRGGGREAAALLLQFRVMLSIESSMARLQKGVF